MSLGAGHNYVSITTQQDYQLL